MCENINTVRQRCCSKHKLNKITQNTKYLVIEICVLFHKTIWLNSFVNLITILTVIILSNIEIPTRYFEAGEPYGLKFVLDFDRPGAIGSAIAFEYTV